MRLWQNISLGRYYSTNSLIHALDPRTKLLACVIIMITMMLIDTWIAIALWLAFLTGLIFIARIPLQLFAKNLRAFLWLFSLTIILHGLTHATAPHFEVMWGISISLPGIMTGCIYAARLMMLVVIAALLSYTTLPTDLTDGLEKMLKPLERLKFPVHEMALMTALAIRFVPTIIDEALRIQRAQISRGARFDGGVLRRIRALIPMLIPLFVGTFNRADELAVAMEARCYRGGEGRISYRDLVFSSSDFLAFFLTCVVSLLIIIIGL